jgi:hypothetical protein
VHPFLAARASTFETSSRFCTQMKSERENTLLTN